MPSTTPLPHAPIGRLMGLVMAMRETPGPDDISHLAQALHLELDDLLPLLKAGQLLDWVRVEGGDYDLTPEGSRVADADERERKILFRQRAKGLPLLRLILGALEAAAGRPVPRETIHRQLAGRFSAGEADRQIDSAIDWGRYAELFDYEADEGSFLPA